MTIADLQAYVGAPATHGSTYHVLRDDLLHTAWQDALHGEAGWWWAISCGDSILAMGWTVGSRADRDRELAHAHELAQLIRAALQRDDLRLN